MFTTVTQKLDQLCVHCVLNTHIVSDFFIYFVLCILQSSLVKTLHSLTEVSACQFSVRNSSPKKLNEQCTFCQNDTETLIHLFWTCSVSTLFWQDFKQWAVNRGELSNTINLMAYLVVGLNPNKNKRQDFYFLIARFFLWVCKTCNTFPKIENFFLFLSHYDTPRTNT